MLTEIFTPLQLFALAFGRWASKHLRHLIAFGMTLLVLSPVYGGIDYQQKASELLPVDCLLPGAIRKLGAGMTYITPRRPVKTTGVDCEIRGGEYVQFDRANYETALSIWLPMAESGDPKAQNYVGEIYEKGLGVEPDFALAASWYLKAAEQDYRSAQTNIGQLYERGLGVEYSMEKALSWYRKSANIEGKELRFVSYDYSDEKIADMEKRLEKSEQQVAVQSSRIQFLAKRLDASETHERRAEQQLAAKKAKLSAEIAALSKQRNQMQSYQSEVRSLREQLKAQLVAKRQAEQPKQAVAASAAKATRFDKKKMERLQKELQVSEAKLNGLSDTLSQREKDIAERELVLKKKDLKLAEIVAENNRLQRELEETQSMMVAAISSMEPTAASPAASDTPPVIEMIEPPLVATRGVPNEVITTRSGVDQRTVIGQIKSANPVLEVLINDQSIEFDSKGMFQHRVPLTRSLTDVSVVAIDTMGLRSDLSFKLKMDYSAETDLYAKRTEQLEASSAVAVPDVDFGEYHALVIGNSQYKHLPKLNSTIADADAMQAMLQDRYGFKVTKLIDATRYDILSALNTLRSELDEDDNLLVYYAGHGEMDQVNERGHWLPIDAEETSTANWISNVAITDILNAMSVRKVLVVADSCYSGSMTRSTLSRLDAGRSPEAWKSWLKLMSEKRSRLSFSSGGLAPVLDGGGGKHSIFAKALLDALKSNRTVVEGRQLHAQVAQAVSYAAQAAQFEQAPQYAPIQFAGHESGDFLFVPRQ